MSFPTMEKQQMRTLRLALIVPVAVLISCGGGSSSAGSEASPSPTDEGAEITYKVGDTDLCFCLCPILSHGQSPSNFAF